MAADEGWKNRIQEVKVVSADELRVNPANWRTHPPVQAMALRGLLGEVGIVAPLLAYYSERADGALTLIDGHLRLTTGGEWPCAILDVDDAEADLLLATFDPITALAEADTKALAELLEEIDTEAISDEGLTELLDQLLIQSRQRVKGPVNDSGPEIDRADELLKKWKVLPGQLWQLGDHRLICGDCNDTAIVERVLAGEQPNCVVTDPPYGVGVEYDAFQDTPEEVERLIAAYMPIVLEMQPVAITPGIPMMWSYPKPDWLLAWIHPAASGNGPWGFTTVNPIIVYGADPYLANGMGRQPGHIVIAADRAGEDIHPVTKPLDVWAWLIERMSVDEGDIVFDPFCGSGTTIIACQQLGRQARGIEISPAYVAVALERFHVATGIAPQRLNLMPGIAAEMDPRHQKGG